MKANQVADRMLAKFSDRHQSVTANVHDHSEINNSLFKVVCTLTSADCGADKIALAIAASVGNELSVVPNSFRRIPRSGVPAVIGFLRANNVSREYTEQAVANMKVVAKNVLMDASDESLWEVRSSGDSKYLVRQCGDDLGKLVQLARVRTFNVPKLNQMVTASFGKHEYISYVCAATNEVKHGFVLGAEDGGAADDDDSKLVVYSEGDEDLIDPTQIVEQAFVGDALAEIAAEKKMDLPANLSGKDGLKKYYDELYSYAPEYMRELDSIIDSHAVA